MRFYCSECEDVYDDNFLNSEYNPTVGSACFKCSYCNNSHLVALDSPASLALCWNEERQKINCIQYDQNTMDIFNAKDVSIDTIGKILSYYMDSIGVSNVDLGNIKVIKDKKSKSI